MSIPSGDMQPNLSVSAQRITKLKSSLSASTSLSQQERLRRENIQKNFNTVYLFMVELKKYYDANVTPLEDRNSPDIRSEDIRKYQPNELAERMRNYMNHMITAHGTLRHELREIAKAFGDLDEDEEVREFENFRNGGQLSAANAFPAVGTPSAASVRPKTPEPPMVATNPVASSTVPLPSPPNSSDGKASGGKNSVTKPTSPSATTTIAKQQSLMGAALDAVTKSTPKKDAKTSRTGAKP